MLLFPINKGFIHSCIKCLNFIIFQGEISADELSSRLLLLSFGHEGCIAGILDLKKGEGITIVEAEKRRLIDGTTSLRLLEAQVCIFNICKLKYGG